MSVFSQNSLSVHVEAKKDYTKLVWSLFQK